MKADYPDIKALTNEEPIWFDMNGTPRYAKFHPDLLSMIHAEEAALMRIHCQGCGKSFEVAVRWDKYSGNTPSISAMFDEKRYNYADYGDPPRHGCVGDSMCSESIAVVEFWVKEKNWVRRQEYERLLPIY